MTPEEREALYDAEIAPALIALCRKCEEAGMSFLADVEWDAEKVSGGTTVALAAQSSYAIRLIQAAMQARGNVDGLIIAIVKHAREHGHNSIFVNLIEKQVSA